MKTNFEKFVNHVSGEMWQAGQYSAAKTCLVVLRGLFRVVGERGLYFESLTPNLVQEYEHNLQSRGCAPGTVSLYMRTFRTLCRKAEDSGAKVPKGLFDKAFMGAVTTMKRSVSPELVQKLSEAELVGVNKRYAFARDLFLLSIYLCGIPFIDLAKLRKCDLKNEVLTYRRSKTGHQAHVWVEPCAMEIILRYMQGDGGSSGYLLPIIRVAGSCEYERLQYESALRLYNKHLKALSGILQLDVRLTSYVARHTWATTAHDLGVDIADISAALCHSSEKMTRHYIRSFSLEHMAKVNQRVIACINGRIRGSDKKEKRLKQRCFEGKNYSGSL